MKLLALTPGGWISRRSIGSTLWPDSTVEQRQGNVRQAIHRLKSLVGPNSILVEGDRCRLSNEIEVTRDGDYRPEELVNLTNSTELNEPPAQPITHFFQYLRWLADHDPLQMFDNMRSNLGVCAGFRTEEMGYLLERVASKPITSRLVQGWRHYWFGQTHLLGVIDTSAAHFGEAYAIGQETGDQLLTSESIHWLTATKILSGQLPSAFRLASSGLEYAATLKSKEIKARLDHAMGTALLHQGCPAEAIALFERANPALEKRIFDWALNETLRALYEACSGNPDGAMRHLEEPERVRRGAAHATLDGLSALAYGYIGLAQREWSMALSSFGKIVPLDVAQSHFGIYAREGEAVAYAHLGEDALSWKSMATARKFRKRMNLAYTEWDRSRILPFAEGAPSFPPFTVGRN